MKLIFVYNAESGPLSAVLDGLHKLLSPETYPCELCALTYGKIMERREWKEFRKRSPYEMTFYHRDEFEEIYDKRFTYPVVLAEKDGDLEPVLTKAQMAEMSDVDDMIAAVEALEGGPETRGKQGAGGMEAEEEMAMQMKAGGPHFDWVMDAE